MKIFKTRRSFRKEFKRQIRLAVIAAIGFTVAFAWRNAIYEAFKGIVEKFISTTQFAATEIFTALTITIIGVALIFITSRILKE